ncbi:hypothetical protein C0991_007532 [Blastosporella zonata]|nr:hypothetical protein C0991_007532 [Blastosporella zonata]
MRALSLAFCKSRGSAQHEYIVLKAMDILHNLTYHIVFERSPSLRVQSTTSVSSLPRASASVSSVLTSVSTSSDIIIGVPALDTVTWLEHGVKKKASEDQEMATLTFPESAQLYLYHIILLVNSIHNSKPTYQLFARNCYYLAGAVGNILEGDLIRKEKLPWNMKRGRYMGHKEHYKKEVERFENLLLQREEHMQKEKLDAQKQAKESEKREKETAKKLEVARKKEKESQKEIEKLLKILCLPYSPFASQEAQLSDSKVAFKVLSLMEVVATPSVGELSVPRDETSGADGPARSR